MCHSKSYQIVSNWARHFVLPLGLCPFATSSILQQNVRISVFKGSKYQLDSFIDEEFRIAASTPLTEISSTLVVLERHYSRLPVFLKAVKRQQQRLKNSENYSQLFQLAYFHPRSVFAKPDHIDIEPTYQGTDARQNELSVQISTKDPSHFAGRAPYPILHLLRNEELRQAVETAPDVVAKLSERNSRRLRELGYDNIQARFDACWQSFDEKS